MQCTTFPNNGQDATALPAEFNSVTEWANAAGKEHARELLECVVFFQGRDSDIEIAQRAGRAVLHGFITPLLPLLADALVLLGDDASAGLVSGLLDDLAHGAGHALDLMGDERGTHGR